MRGISLAAIFRIFVLLFAIFSFPALIFAQTNPSAPASPEQIRQIMELETQINALLVRRAAERANAIMKNTIPPANNSAEAKEAALRVVRPDMHPLDPGNLRYGTTFVFACAPNGRGSFTAYGLTATHVLHRPEDNFIDTGGAYNVNARNAEKKGVLSYGYRVLAEMGKDFEVRNQNDPLMRDSAVIAFDVAACPKAVISIKSFIASGEHVTPTGFPYTSPGRVQTQSPKCSMISSGNAQPCKIEGDVVKGYSGGPITADDGQAIGITSAGEDGLILADNTEVMRSMLESLCRAKPPKIPYYYVDKKKIDCPR